MINNYYDLLYILLKNRKTIILTSLAFAVLAAGVSLVLRVKYRASAVLMPPVSQGAILTSLLTRTSIMSDPEVGGTGFMPGMNTPSDVFAFMLKSGTVGEIVIEECGLTEHYRQTRVANKRPDKARYNVSKQLEKATKIKVTEERFITITVEDKDKHKAAEVANKYVEALDRVYSKMTMTQGGRMRSFIEGRVDQELASLRLMEDSLKVYQQRHRTMSITDEMKAVIEMSAVLEAKILGQKIELEALKSYASPENVQVKALETQVEKAREELDNLLEGKRGRTLFVPMSQAPAVGLKLSQLMRDVKIRQELYALLIQQLEHAKILEAKDTPKLQILERAAPPYKKSWPKRSLITLIGGLTGFIIGLSIVFINTWWEGQLKNPEAIKQLEKIAALISK